jgi:hypothetical protein
MLAQRLAGRMWPRDYLRRPPRPRDLFGLGREIIATGDAAPVGEWARRAENLGIFEAGSPLAESQPYGQLARIQILLIARLWARCRPQRAGRSSYAGAPLLAHSPDLKPWTMKGSDFRNKESVQDVHFRRPPKLSQCPLSGFRVRLLLSATPDISRIIGTMRKR